MHVLSFFAADHLNHHHPIRTPTPPPAELPTALPPRFQLFLADR